jgi:hypothetical protein
MALCSERFRLYSNCHNDRSSDISALILDCIYTEPLMRCGQEFANAPSASSLSGVSTHHLAEAQLSLLSKGLNFCPTPKV